MKVKYLIIWSLLVLLFIGTFSVSLSYLGTKVNRNGVNNTSFKTGKMNLSIVDSKLENVTLAPIYDKDYSKSGYSKEFLIISEEDSLNSCANIYLDITEISDSLKSEYLKYKLVANNKTYEGNFKDANNVDNFLLADNIFIEKGTSNNYNLYIWISYDDNVDQMDMLNPNLVARVVLKSYDSEDINSCVNNN